MRLGEGVEWALHCAAILAVVPRDRALTAARLAEFHGVPPAYLAKTMQTLARAGVVESVPGRRGGYRLARRARDVTVLDVVEAVEGRASSFRCTEIRKRGPTRVRAGLYPPVCAIAAVMYRADEAWRAELRNVTLADLLNTLGRQIGPESATKTASWMQEAMR